MGSDCSAGRKSSNNTDPAVKNDYAFLQEIKNANHTATVGGFNRRYQSKVANKRKSTDEENGRREREAQRALAEHEECYPNTRTNASETDSEADIIEESKTKYKQPKSLVLLLSPSVCAVADKHQVSHGLSFFYHICFTISFRSISFGIWITFFMSCQCSLSFFFSALIFFICTLSFISNFTLVSSVQASNCCCAICFFYFL